MKTNEIVHWIKNNPVVVLLGSGFVVSVILSFDNIHQNFQRLSQLRTLTAINTAKEQEVIAYHEHEIEQSKIAEQRYKTGCLMVFTGQVANTFSSLSEGFPVVDRNRRKPLPSGTVVCDANGNTGQMITRPDGKIVVGAVAYTGNKAVVNAAKKQFNARYYVPSQE